MDTPARRRFTAKQAEFDAIREFIESACAAVREDERMRVLLLVEELFANSVMHGYGGDSDQPIWLTVAVTDEGCRLVYEDSAPPHNPFLTPGPDLDESDIHERRIGGLGIVFLNELSSARTYERRGDRNVIELHVSRAA